MRVVGSGRVPPNPLIRTAAAFAFWNNYYSKVVYGVPVYAVRQTREEQHWATRRFEVAG